MDELCSDLMIMLAMEDTEVHLHALQAMTEQFQLCELCLGKLHHCSETVSAPWDAPD
jgi:hypothetical protein